MELRLWKRSLCRYHLSRCRPPGMSDKQNLVYIVVGVGVVVIVILGLAIFIGVRVNRRK